MNFDSFVMSRNLYERDAFVTNRWKFYIVGDGALVFRLSPYGGVITDDHTPIIFFHTQMSRRYLRYLLGYSSSMWLNCQWLRFWDRLIKRRRLGNIWTWNFDLHGYLVILIFKIIHTFLLLFILMLAVACLHKGRSLRSLFHQSAYETTYLLFPSYELLRTALLLFILFC